MKTDLEAVRRAISAAGGPAAVGRELVVSTQAVCFWRDGLRAVPEKFGADLERLSGRVATRQEMWPDNWRRIWPELEQAQPVLAGEGV